jgi:hypothetical protein
MLARVDTTSYFPGYDAGHTDGLNGIRNDPVTVALARVERVLPGNVASRAAR